MNEVISAIVTALVPTINGLCGVSPAPAEYAHLNPPPVAGFKQPVKVTKHLSLLAVEATCNSGKYLTIILRVLPNKQLMIEGISEQTKEQKDFAKELNSKWIKEQAMQF
jgi:hypothetical protein